MRLTLLGLVCLVSASCAQPHAQTAQPSEREHVSPAIEATPASAGDSPALPAPAGPPEPMTAAAPVPAGSPDAARDAAMAAVGVVEITSDLLLDAHTTSCPAVLIAPDVILFAAHCLDWHRAPTRGAPITGTQRFTLPSGAASDVVSVQLHPLFRYVACDDSVDGRYLLLCGVAQAECALRYISNPSGYLTCSHLAAMRVKELLGGASRDLAVGYLMNALRDIAPLSPAYPTEPPATLAVLDAVVGAGANEHAAWVPSAASFRGMRDTDWLVGSTGPDAYASLAFCPRASGWQVAALGSRPVAWAGAPASTDLIYAPLDETWLRAMLGARLGR